MNAYTISAEQVAAEHETGAWTTAQQVTLDGFDRPCVAKPWNDRGTITVYVYGPIFVVRYFIAVDGWILSSEQCHASACDRDVRRQLLAQWYGEA